MAETMQGQTAIVTGASRGIGRAIAIQLGELGMNVVLTARDENALQETAEHFATIPGNALVHPADVTRAEEVAALFEAALQPSSSIDLVVNNAGSLAALGPLWATEADAWLQDIVVNLQGVYLCCREALQHMLPRNRGRIINMTGGGAGGPFPFAAAYATSKAGVVRLTETLAAELQETHPDSQVKVFTMSPGFVRTAMTEQFAQTDTGRKWMHRLAARLDRGESAPPEFAAELVAELASGRMDFLHGRYIHAEADRDTWNDLKRRAEEIQESDARTLRLA